MNFTGLLSRIIGMAGVALCTMAVAAFGQSEPKVDHQCWIFSYNYFKINDKATFNQDVSYQQSLENHSAKQFSLKSQFNYSLSSIVSFHGGLAFYFSDNGHSPNSQEVRPWLGAKLQWPSFWRLDFTHYVKLEERFIHEQAEDPWSAHMRARYKLGATLPINNAAITDNTLYLALAYQYVSSPFNKGFVHKHTDYQRFEVGPGFKFDKRSRLETLLVYVEHADPILDKFTLSSLALQLKYFHYFNF